MDHHIQVKVKRRGDDKKFTAKVLAIGTDCDTALLTVDDPSFWEDVEPLQFGQLPKLQDRVFVIGYPIGGDTISGEWLCFAMYFILSVFFIYVYRFYFVVVIKVFVAIHFQCAVTSGVVSRIEVTSYVHSTAELLGIQASKRE